MYLRPRRWPIGVVGFTVGTRRCILLDESFRAGLLTPTEISMIREATAVLVSVRNSQAGDSPPTTP
jgi:hypothetical protein